MNYNEIAALTVGLSATAKENIGTNSSLFVDEFISECFEIIGGDIKQLIEHEVLNGVKQMEDAGWLNKESGDNEIVSKIIGELIILRMKDGSHDEDWVPSGLGDGSDDDGMPFIKG